MESTKNNDYIKKIQGERIRLLMRKCNVTGKQIAEKLNYSPQHISYIINGKRTLTVEVATALADFFSECLNATNRVYVSFPYSEMSEEDKAYYKDEVDENGEVTIGYDEHIHIDYRYILGEADYMTFMENFDPPHKKSADYLFKEGIVALLHHYGYDLDICFCPDITCFDDIKPCSIMHSFTKKLFLDSETSSKITNKGTGYSIDMLPADVFQLFQDFSKAIIGIVERKFERQQWFDAIHAPIPPHPQNDDTHLLLESGLPDTDTDIDDNINDV